MTLTEFDITFKGDPRHNITPQMPKKPHTSQTI